MNRAEPGLTKSAGTQNMAGSPATGAGPDMTSAITLGK